MTIYEAIRTMRALSKAEIPFAFSFMSYDRTRQKTSGIITVTKARLRNRGKEEYNEYAEIQEEYLDLDSNEPRRFWHCTLMTFNGKKLTI